MEYIDPRTEDTININEVQRRAERREEKRKGPMVGDYIRMKDRRLCRFAHDHGKAGLQTTDGRFGSSFYLQQNGSCSFSGGLDPCLPRANIVATDDEMPANMWIFHHGIPGKDRGVTYQVVVPVWEEV